MKVSWGGRREMSGLPVFHKGWSGAVLEQPVLEVFTNFLAVKDKLPQFSLDVVLEVVRICSSIMQTSPALLGQEQVH
eukprot:scaffold368430_cov59-Attheya_sp.AAC.9